MAQEIEVKVKVVTEQAVNNVDALGNAFDQTAKDAKEAQEVFSKAGNGVKVEESIAGLKQLKRELKNVAVGSEEFKIIYNQIDDLEDKLKSAKNVSSDWVDSLESAGGPLGMLGASINKAKVATQSFGGALKATGIGLIVSLLAGLAGAFANNEGAMKKLQPLLDGMAKIFQGVFRAVEPLFNTLVDLAISALPMVQKAFGSVYSVVTATLQSFGAIGSAIGKLMEGDFKGAWASAKSSVSDFGKNYDASLKRFEAGAKELTKTEKEESDKRAENRKAAQEKQREEDLKAREKAEADKKAYLDKANTFDEENNLKAVDTEKIKTENDILSMQNNLKNKVAIGQNGVAEQKRMFAEAAQDEIDLEKKKSEVIADVKQNLNNIIAGIEATGLAKSKAGQAAMKALGLVQIGIDTALAFSKAVPMAINAGKEAASVAGPAAPFVGPIATAASYLSSASMIAGNIMKAKTLLGGGGPSIPTASGGGGGISTPASMPVNPSVVGESGVNQLAKSLNGTPIKAYVVSKDMTTQQSLDRNITDTASLG